MNNPLATANRHNLLSAKNKHLQKIIHEKNKQLIELNHNLENTVLERTAALKLAHDEISKTFESTLEILLAVVEMNEINNKGHCRRVASHAQQLAQAIGLSDKEAKDIYLAAMLHNIGKFGLHPKIRNLPFSTLTQASYHEYINYPHFSAMALRAYPNTGMVATIIEQHKEHLDGSGYPTKIVSKEISIGAKILAIAVDYNELMSGIYYPEKLHGLLALDFLSLHANQYYDAALVKKFIKLIKRMPAEHERLDELALKCDQLKAGMVVTRDIILKHGLALLYQGSVLTDEMIQRLLPFTSLVVYVKQNVCYL